MRRIIPLALAASMAASTFAFTSAASDPILVDVEGDANMLNDQGLLVGVSEGNVAFGVSDPGLDLLTFSADPGKSSTVLRLGVDTVSLNHEAAFRIMTTIDGCDTWFQIYISGDPVPSVRLPADCASGPAGTYTDGVSLELDADTNEYVITLEFKKLAAEVSHVKAGAQATGVELSSRIYPGAQATIPQVDNAADFEVAWKL